MRLHDETRLGPVHYTVADLDAQVAFYREIIGFKVLLHEADFAVLGTDERELLRMTRVADATRQQAATGLYHTAFLVPTKRDLAHLTRTLIDTRTPVQGTSDHGTHLALYLPDPEGNGIELAWDFPREEWPNIDGQVDLTQMPRRGVDVAELLHTIADDAEPWTGVDPGTTVGHVHLHVADLDVSKRFYNEQIGFDVILHSASMGAAFLSAGGYHHHVGMNIWKGRGLPPAAPDTLGLRYFTIVVPDGAEVERIVRRVADGMADVSPNDRTVADRIASDGGNAIHPDLSGLTAANEDATLIHDPSGIGIMLTSAK